MNRFLTILAVAAVAGVMYVAAAPGGLRTTGPTARQFKALVLRVKKDERSLNAVKKLASEEAAILVTCLLVQAPAVDQRGTVAGTGYSYTDPTVNGGSPFLTTALDLAPANATTADFYFLGTSPACAAAINSQGAASAASHVGGALKHLMAQAGR
jgi:hypothetical protein